MRLYFEKFIVPVRHKVWLALSIVFLTPTIAWASGREWNAAFGPVLISLAVLLIAAKLGGLLAERCKQPAVLGELAIGIALSSLLAPIFGRQAIGFVRTNPALRLLSELGVLILLFGVGIESNLRSLVWVGVSSFVVAFTGVAVPFGLGWAAAAWLLPDSHTLVHAFVGASLTATSISVTARVMKDLGVVRTLEGQTILGAAVLDDILGLIVLAVVVGAARAQVAGAPGFSGPDIAGIIVKAVLFIGITVGVGYRFSTSIVELAARAGKQRTLIVFGLALCLTLAYISEMIGLADVVGAFAAGLLLDPFAEGIAIKECGMSLSELLYPLSSFFVPIFFVLMGFRVDLGTLANLAGLKFVAILILCAVLGKLACSLAVIGSGIDRLVIGLAMIPRAEVALIFASIGHKITFRGKPILSDDAFSALILMVLVTTLVTPLALRWAFERWGKKRVQDSY